MFFTRTWMSLKDSSRLMTISGVSSSTLSRRFWMRLSSSPRSWPLKRSRAMRISCLMDSLKYSLQWITEEFQTLSYPAWINASGTWYDQMSSLADLDWTCTLLRRCTSRSTRGVSRGSSWKLGCINSFIHVIIRASQANTLPWDDTTYGMNM